MVFHLIKKDFMLVKKYVLFMMAFAILLPVFFLRIIPEFAGSISLLISGIYAVFMLLQQVSLKETKYPKALALLCATPYPRNALVQSKYGFCIFIYAMCCAIYWIETLALPALGNFTLRMAVAVFFVISVFMGIYLPVQFKLGFEKTKFLLSFVIIASPFLFSELLKLYGSLDFYAINAIPPAILCGMIALLSLAVLIVSVSISEKIYSRADL